MDEVLEKMFEDTSTAISRDEREMFVAKIKRGQILDYQKDHHGALELWKNVLEQVLRRVKMKETEILHLKVPQTSEAEFDTSSSSDEEEFEDERRAKKRRYLRTKRANELKDLLDLQHRAIFMMASAYYQLKNENEETRLYEEAEAVRRKVSRQNTLQTLKFPDTPAPDSKG